MRLIMVLIVMILLSSCGPSEADIATAIAETEAAKPTATSSSTDTPVPTPLPTSSPNPVESNIPLTEFLISYSDIASIDVELAQQWKDSQVELNCHVTYGSVENECLLIGYLSDVSWAKALEIQINRFSSSADASSMNRALRTEYLKTGELLETSAVLELPNTFWIIQKTSTLLIIGFSVDNISAILFMDNALDSPGLPYYFQKIGQAQYQKINDLIK